MCIYIELIRGTFFPNRLGRYGHMMLLPLLEDFSSIRGYSWGFTVLAYLYRELCKATNYRVRDIGGACILLQFKA